MAAKPKLIDKLSTQLPPAGRRLLKTIVSCAGYLDMPIFLVGGPVRDLLLGRPTLDLDFAVEGDAVRLAEAVAREAHGRVLKRSEFGTAAIRLDDATADLATARAETYTRPGALPRVRPARMDEDLHRRDFTINAVALELGPAAPGRLLDPVGGVNDIRSGRVRVLHDRSFQGDPTRILRAVRYETRLDFAIEEGTRDLIRRDLPYLDRVSGTRLRRELVRTFEEDDPATPLARMQQLGVLAAIHPEIRLDDRQLQSIRALGALQPRMHPVVLAVLAWHVLDDQVPELVTRLALPRAQAEAVLAVPAVRNIRPELVDGLAPSEVDAMLSPLPWATVFALGMAEDTAASWWARKYVGEMERVRTILDGDDLLAMGIPGGPKIGEVLGVLRAAKLDGVVKTREDEEIAVRQLMAAARENGHSG